MTKNQQIIRGFSRAFRRVMDAVWLALCVWVGIEFGPWQGVGTFALYFVATFATRMDALAYAMYGRDE